MTTGFITVRGVDIAYTDVGDGPIVLRAHGLSQSRAADARSGFTDFAPVAERFRLISYDARGHGDSAGNAVPDDYTWSALAEDLVAIADHVSPDKPVSGIGTSMGTATLLYAATRYPERFSSLVLTAPPTAWDTRAGQAEMYAQFADIVETSSADVVATLFSQMPPAPIFDGLDGYPPSPDVSRELLPSVLRGAGRSDLPDPSVLRSIAVPTLVLPWATDPGHPLSTAEALTRLIAGATLEVADDVAAIRTWGARSADFLAASLH